jgi:hypothetical protein
VLRRVLIFLSLLSCNAVIAQDAPATTQSSTAPSTGPTTREWKINSYVHGSAAEIREQVNGELERLLRLRATRLATLKDAGEALRSAKGAKLRDAQAALKEAQVALKETESAVGRAYLWRRQMVEGIRSKYLMHWPLTPGTSGVLGVVTPLKIDPASSAIILRFPALERLRNEDHREGITRQKVLVHDVGFIVSGVETGSLKVGTPAALDANFVVLSKDPDSRAGPLYNVMRKADELDELMHAVNDLREPIDPKEMARMVRESVPKKANSKTWVSIDRILSTTRPVKDPNPDSADFKRVSSWLERELPGDHVAMRVDVLKVLPREDGNYDFHGTVDASDGKLHFVIGSLLPSAIQRGKRVEGQKDERIRGTILDAHLSDENTVILELIDIEFGW